MEQDRGKKGIEVLSRLTSWDGKRVLEVGCGEGESTHMLVHLAGSLVAIDPDEERLAKARGKFPDVDFRQGWGERLDFPDESFDIVAFTFSLHHQDGGRALSEATRVLKPSGQVVIVEPAIDGIMHALFHVFGDEDDEIKTALKAIEECGLSREISETFEMEFQYDDIEELYTFFFENRGREREQNLMEGIKRLLADQISCKPIKLIEVINIYSLKKK